MSTAMPKKPTSSYLICTTPRSGSWMLCSILSQTGIAGQPSEFFGPTLQEEFKSNRYRVHASDVKDYMERIMACATTENGVFGMKLLANQAPIFMRYAAEHRKRPFASLREALESEYPTIRYLLLTRENKVAQAISYYRGLMTGHWQRGVNSQKHQTPAPTVEYDHFAIQRCYQDILLFDAYWEGYFRTHGISPLTFTYEELVSRRGPTMERVLKYLGLTSTIPIPEPTTIKLANEESLAWEDEFRHRGPMPDHSIALQLPAWPPF